MAIYHSHITSSLQLTLVRKFHPLPTSTYLSLLQSMLVKILFINFFCKFFSKNINFAKKNRKIYFFGIFLKILFQIFFQKYFFRKFFFKRYIFWKEISNLFSQISFCKIFLQIFISKYIFGKKISNKNVFKKIFEKNLRQKKKFKKI